MNGPLLAMNAAAVRVVEEEGGIPWEVKVVGADIKRRVPRYRAVW